MVGVATHQENKVTYQYPTPKATSQFKQFWSDGFPEKKMDPHFGGAVSGCVSLRQVIPCPTRSFVQRPFVAAKTPKYWPLPLLLPPF
jgi:hypothetical protein